MVVGDKYLARGVYAHANRIVGDALAADLPQILALVVEHLDAVCPVVRNEYLLFVVDHHAVGKLQVLGAPEFDQHVAGLVEDDDAHHFALDYYNAALVVDGDATGVLQYVGAKLAYELSVLIVDLDLVCGRTFGDDYVAGRLDHCHAVGVQQLPVPFAALAELELESALLVEYLDSVVVGVRHDDVVLRVHRHAAGLSKLAFHGAELAELAVVDHLVSLDLRLRWEYGRGEQFAGQVQYGVVVVDGQREVSATVLEYITATAIGPLLVRVDAVHATTVDAVSTVTTVATAHAVDSVHVADGVQVQVADRAGRKRSQTVDAVKPLGQDVVGVVLAGRQRASGRQPVGIRTFDDATVAASSVGAVDTVVLLHQVCGTTTVHATVGDDRRISVHQRSVCRTGDRRLFARPDHSQFGTGPHVPESVPYAHLYGLIVGHEFQIADVLNAVVGFIAHKRLELGVQKFLEQQALDHIGVFGQTIDELTSLVDLVHDLQPLLRCLVQRQLLGTVHALHLFQKLLFTLLEHGPVKCERLIDLVLRFVVLHL